MNLPHIIYIDGLYPITAEDFLCACEEQFKAAIVEFKQSNKLGVFEVDMLKLSFTVLTTPNGILAKSVLEDDHDCAQRRFEFNKSNKEN